MKHYLNPTILLVFFYIVSCTDTGTKDNPFDSNGNNWYPPVLNKVNDKTVKYMESVEVSVSATDPNGTIEMFYWDTNYDSKWDDSGTTLLNKEFSKPEGGSLPIIWGARDNDGVVSCDTFLLYFNVPPQEVDFPDTIYQGQINWSVIDPDSIRDTLTYQLMIGSHPDSLIEIYQGRNAKTQYNLSHLSTYHYKLLTKDFMGDTLLQTGSFFTPPPSGMVKIPAKDSTFVMGAPASIWNGVKLSNEQPVHNVTFSKDYYMDTTEVTYAQYVPLMRENYAVNISPSVLDMPNSVIYDINWYDAILYCNARSKQELKDTVYTYTAINGTAGHRCTLENVEYDFTKDGYRLPTEAEWEYACRAGTKTTFFWGDESYLEYCWPQHQHDDPRTYPKAFALKKPNNFGLYDMNGNVWEMVNDWYGEYPSEPQTDPTGPSTGNAKVVRGGGVLPNYAKPGYAIFDLTSTRRKGRSPDAPGEPVYGWGYYGFRTVCQL